MGSSIEHEMGCRPPGPAGYNRLMTTSGADAAPTPASPASLRTPPTLTLARGGGRPPTPPTGGERRLLTAILEDAVHIVQRDPRNLPPGKRRLCRETRDWFLA